MEKHIKLSSRAGRSDADSLCEEEGWSTEASFTCITHQHMLICKECKNEEHYDWEVAEYYNPKSLYTQVRQVAAMVKHIEKDCNLFKNSSTVEMIRKEVSTYQSKVDKLGERIKNCIDSSIEEYRKISSIIYTQALKIKGELLKSDMCQSYSRLYIRYHLGDMSIFFKEESIWDEASESSSVA